jgi:hypothetical protein
VTPPVDPPTQVTPPAPVAPAVSAPELPPPPPSSGLPNPHGLPEIAVQRPEVAVGAAFAGGLMLATILKRLAR